MPDNAAPQVALSISGYTLLPLEGLKYFIYYIQGFIPHIRRCIRYMEQNTFKAEWSGQPLILNHPDITKMVDRK